MSEYIHSVKKMHHSYPHGRKYSRDTRKKWHKKRVRFSPTVRSHKPAGRKQGRGSHFVITSGSARGHYVGAEQCHCRVHTWHLPPPEHLLGLMPCICLPLPRGPPFIHHPLLLLFPAPGNVPAVSTQDYGLIVLCPRTL